LKTFIKAVLNKINLFSLYKKGIVIDPSSKIANDVFLQPGIKNGITGSLIIGAKCELSKGAVIKCYGGEVKLAQNVFIGEYVTLYGHGGIIIGEHTLIAMHTCIISANHTIPVKNTLIRSQTDVLRPVKIGRDVWIGAGVKILGGVTIGDGCVVGAGAVVTKDLPAYSIAFGVPAKVTGYRND